MDSEIEKKFSFPNSDRYNANNLGADSDIQRPKPVVHITDALNLVKKDDGAEAPIRTFQADIADAIKNDNVSMIKVALAEKKRQETRGKFDTVIETKKNDNIFYIASIGVAIFAVMAFIAFVFFGTKEETDVFVPGNTSQKESIIYSEFSTVIDTQNRDSNDLDRLVARIKEESFDLGNIKEIVLTTGTGTSTRKLATEDFFKFMGTRASDSLIRSLDSNFYFGTYAFSRPYDTFFIFKVNSYDSAFAGMLQWENSLDVDLGGILISKKVLVPSQGTTSTSTASSTPATAKRRMFVDKVMQNKDSRVLIDEKGSVLMLYTFIDKKTLIIASGDKSLKELLFRLTTGRIIR